MSVQVSYKQQFTFFLILLIITLFVIEGVARIYENQEQPCDFIGKDAFDNTELSLQEQNCIDTRILAYTEPDILRFVPNQHTETYNINSFGFRGSEISIEKPNETYRIFMVGGSTTFGAGSFSDEETIPGHLQKLFNENGNNIEIINAGINSGYSYTEKYLIENDLQNFEPDMILLYTGGNDSHRPTIYSTVTLGDYGVNIKDLRFWRTPFIISDYIIETTRYEKTKTQLDDNFIEEKINFWTNNMKDICNTNSKNNTVTIITLHPILANSEKILSPDEQKYTEKHDFQSTPTSLKIYDGLAKNLKSLETSCDKTFDLRPIFKDMSPPIFFDESHINSQGNSIVAKKLFEIILPFVN